VSQISWPIGDSMAYRCIAAAADVAAAAATCATRKATRRGGACAFSVGNWDVSMRKSQSISLTIYPVVRL